MSDSPAPGVDGGNELIQKMAEATRCTIIRLYICLNGIVTQVDLTRSLTIRTKQSHSLFLYKERSFPCVLVWTLYQREYVWSWSHSAGIICVPTWSHMQRSQFFGFWSYFLWQTWCAVIWCWGNRFHWCTWGHRNGDLLVLTKDGFRKTCNLNSLQKLNLALHCFDF